jgi:glycosyltransferase involved in cell wall biosynthesis
MPEFQETNAVPAPQARRTGASREDILRCGTANIVHLPTMASPAPSPLSIMQVFAPSEAGGLPRVVEGLAIGHRRAGHSVTVAAIYLDNEPESSGMTRLRSAGVDVRRVNISPRGYRRERQALVSLYREMRPQVVHTHGARPDVVGGLGAARERLPAVTTLHGRTGGGLKWRLFEWIQHRAIRRFRAIVAVSRPQVDYLKTCGVPPERIHLIPNAFTPGVAPLSREEARRALGVRHDEPLVGWVGRLSAEKGADVFIDALAQLGNVRVRASILGDGSEAASLRAKALAVNVEHRIHWHGTVPDAGRYFPAFDAFVLSSRTEGTPIVLFEAMAARVPIVTTRVGGVPDVVSESEAKLVPSDDPVALAAALADTLRNRAEAGGRTERANARLASQFGAGPWLRRYEDLYRSVLKWS